MNAKSIRFLLLTVMAVLVAGTAFLCLESGKARNQRVCEGMRVTFKENFNFITEDDVKEWVEREYGHYVGKRLDSLELWRIEDIVDNQAAVRKSEVFTTSDGMLNINITQREPVLKLVKSDYSFYVDGRGFIFPLQKNYDSPVPVIYGEIPITCNPGFKGKVSDPKESLWLQQTLGMMDYLSGSKQWSGYVGRISVTKTGDMVINPAEGKENVIFGAPDRCKEKLELLGRYYDTIKPAKEEGYYSTVNVKYRGQIICRK